jgi:uncharacterized membrane protein
MAQDGFYSTERRPIYPLVAAFAASCLLGTLATDIVYWWTADIMWADFSAWLVSAGVIVGWATVIIALIKIVALRSARFRHGSGAYASALVVALIVILLIMATLDMLVHTRDAWTSVVPWGVILSAGVAALVLIIAYMSRITDESGDVGVTG